MFIDYKKPIEKFDKIIFSSKEQIDKMLEWRDNNKELVRNFNFVLEQGVIQTTFNTMNIIFEKQGDKLYLDSVFEIDGVYRHILTLYWDYKTKNIEVIHPNHINFSTDDIQSMITIVASLLAYMEHYQEEKEVIQKKKTFKNISKKSKKKNKKNTRKAIRTVYHLKQIQTQDIQKQEKREYNRDESKSWTVRGHWRNYKNGNRVWIPSYKKGNKDKDESTIYKL